MLKFLVICMLAACCHAQNSGDSLLSRIEEHQDKLRNWEEENSRLLTSLTVKRKIYDNAKQNEAKLLEVVDYLVKKNMEILQNVVSELNTIHINMDKDVDGAESLSDIDMKALENKLGTSERSLASESAEGDGIPGEVEEANIERHGDGEESLSDTERNLESELAEDEETVTHADENQENNGDGAETLSDTEIRNLESKLAEGDEVAGDVEEANVERHGDGEERLSDTERNLESELAEGDEFSDEVEEANVESDSPNGNLYSDIDLNSKINDYPYDWYYQQNRK